MEDLKRIAKHYGREKQTQKTIEELAELIQALSKTLLKEETNIVEEIADVEIMLEQSKLLYEIEVDVEEIKKKKIDRQLERIEKDKGL